MSDSRSWSAFRARRTIIVAHFPLALAGPALLTLTWRNGAPGCEVLFCRLSHAEVFTISALFWFPVLLAVGLIVSASVNLFRHRRMRFLTWSEVRVACLVSYPVVLTAFVLLADPFRLMSRTV